MAEHVILFTGPMGAGKTTAIQSLSDIPVIGTEAANSDREQSDKPTTTVALDYGEILVSDEEKVRLYGIPGQRRFEFMWRILATDALGLVILIDNSRPEPLDDLAIYLDAYQDLLPSMNCAVGIGRTLECPLPTIDDFCDMLAARGLVFPVLSVDVRQRDDVLMLVDTVLAQAEVRA